MDLSMSRAQSAYDSRAEPDFDEDDRLDDESAAEIAQGELDATPALVADWLQAECKDEDSPINPIGLAYSSKPSAALLLLHLMTCDRDRMQGWVYALREKFAEHCDAAGACKARADELLAADERERYLAAESAAADRFQQREAEMAAWEDRREH